PTYRPCARASATGWPACGSSPCRPRGSSPAEGSPAVIPDSESAPRTCLLSSTLIRGIMVHHCPTRRVYKKDTCLRIDLCTGTKRTLIDTNETSHPPYRGELRTNLTRSGVSKGSVRLGAATTKLQGLGSEVSRTI